MRAFKRELFFTITIIAAAVCATAQSPAQKEPTGSIAGRITVDGKPARNVAVMLHSNEDRQQRLASRTTTDEEGNFKLSRLPAGSYTIRTYTPALVEPLHGSDDEEGKSVILDDGDEVEGINISLARGGVITGRITDAEGNPLAEERVTLIKVEPRGGRQPFYWRNEMLQTDDRGVYRSYGLPAGRYIVGAGSGKDTIISTSFMRGPKHSFTYYPDATDEAAAKIIEVTAGSEHTDIDIALGRPSKSFTASGRIVDAATGRPVANVNFGVATIIDEESRGSTTLGNRTNANGEFRLEGLAPGRYAAIAWFEPPSEFYGEPAQFEISDGDVSGIVVKVRRGTSLSGQVIIEGLNEKQMAELMPQLMINASVESPDKMNGSINSRSELEADGSFRITGLPAGKARFFIISIMQGTGFMPRKIELDGIEHSEGVELKAGEHVSGLKVSIDYGTGRIRGRVKIEGGELPEGAEVQIYARSLNDKQRGGYARADLRGNFIIERLVPGEYELNANAFNRSAGQPVHTKRTAQKVTVSNDEETQVTITLELTGRKESRQ